MKKILIITLIFALLLSGCEKVKNIVNSSQNVSSGKFISNNTSSDENFIAMVNTSEPSKESYEAKIGPVDTKTSYTLSSITDITNIDSNTKKAVDDLASKIKKIIGWLMYQPALIGVGKKYVINQDNNKFYIVDNPLFPNMGELKKYMKTVMSDTLIKKFLDGIDIIEYGGHLYALDGVEGGSVYDEKRLYSITYQDTKKINFDVYVSDPDQKYYKCYMNIEMVNGNWIVADTNLP